MDAFKNNLFGQLKNYGDAVQGAFEQRVARPLLALKRDLSRSSSTARQSSDQDSQDERTGSTQTQSTPSSSPVELETNGPLKAIFDKVKTTLSSSSNESMHSTANPVNPNPKDKSLSEISRQLSISSQSSQEHRNNKLKQQKSVSFAEPESEQKKTRRLRSTNTDDDDNDNDPLIHSTNERTKISFETDQSSTKESGLIDEEDDFRRRFYQSIKPRRISIGNCRDLVYQDLSAEIVAYVLKHALRTLEEEDEQLRLLAIEQAQSGEDQSRPEEGKVPDDDGDDDFIDLK